MGAPGSPGVPASFVDLDGAFKTGVRGAWGTSSTASSPVDVVDLPESNIEGFVGVVVHGVGISSAFVRDDAFAAVLVPAVFSAP